MFDITLLTLIGLLFGLAAANVQAINLDETARYWWRAALQLVVWCSTVGAAWLMRVP